MYFKAYLQTQCICAWHHGNIKRNQPGPKKYIVDLFKSGSSLGEISKRLTVPRSSIQTIARKYKHNGTTQPSYRSGRRCVLSPRDERTLVRKVQINPRTTALRFATAHWDKDRTFWRNVLWSDETKIELFGHNDRLEEKGGSLQAEEHHCHKYYRRWLPFLFGWRSAVVVAGLLAATDPLFCVRVVCVCISGFSLSFIFSHYLFL